MNSIEQSIANSMDCTNNELIPFLPYILQDFWEIGTSPAVIKDLVKQYETNYQHLQIVDLGCGKGAVSIRLAAELQCHCLGIDAIEPFIREAQIKAKAFQVDSLCSFEVNDLRQRIHEITMADVIILGAIGPVFGNYYETLSRVSPALNETGLIIIDDGYIEDSSSFAHPLMLKKGELLQQIHAAGMQLIDAILPSATEEQEKTYDEELHHIEKRCHELVVKYPEKANLFEMYIRQQREEYDILAHKVISATMVLKRAIH
ncbi:MAG: hypothetical protein ALAOOOJD_04047 [bacterium]|nr:hypothetical protein [bacterium]